MREWIYSLKKLFSISLWLITFACTTRSTSSPEIALNEGSSSAILTSNEASHLTVYFKSKTNDAPLVLGTLHGQSCVQNISISKLSSTLYSQSLKYPFNFTLKKDDASTYLNVGETDEVSFYIGQHPELKEKMDKMCQEWGGHYPTNYLFTDSELVDFIKSTLVQSISGCSSIRSPTNTEQNFSCLSPQYD
jgi:hypothetical protein